MSVALISYSQPPNNTIDAEKQTLQDSICYCARVSNPTNQQNTETNKKLLAYLITHKHWSPLEMVNICLEIETTRDIARQILRHRSFSFQEFSQRYANPEMDFEVRETRRQDYKNRQNSIEMEDPDSPLSGEWEHMQRLAADASRMAYEWAITHGIAKEQARVVLPEGMTKTRMYMNGTLRSWVHYIQLRSGKETQKEHRKIALECANAIEPIFPMIKEFVLNT
jgi:thymidylate synthase (FAD)